MSGSFYPKLAWTGIRMNKRMYLPYLLTCAGMVMMHYIIAFLYYNENIATMHGGSVIIAMMGFGTWVIALFSCIFLFYTNSFLIRRRKKEFGLYNILGMGKHNIGRILLWETLIVSVLSLVAGLMVGIALSKLAEFGLVNIMHADVNFDLSVSVQALVQTLGVFAVIFVLLLLNALRQLRFSSAISLLRSETVGEKPPKANWVLGILGVLILGVAYYIAVTIQDPIAALVLFFVAVVMVIVATYLIMISGSVLLCRILQKNKRYYYKANHFVSVSSMAYRMKRNGAGLASICILATMVLVMISSSACLYFGADEALRNRYPKEVNTEYYMAGLEDLSDENVSALREKLISIAQEENCVPAAVHDYRVCIVAGMLGGEDVQLNKEDENGFSVDTLTKLVSFYFVPLSDYNAMMGTNETLADDEAIIYTHRFQYKSDRLSFGENAEFHIVKSVDDFVTNGDIAMDVSPSMMLFVPDLEKAVSGMVQLNDENGYRMMSLRWVYNFDTGLPVEQHSELCQKIYESTHGPEAEAEYGFTGLYVAGREAARDDFFGTYGGLFYLGIILSIVFIFAAVLIIYYKQISEGYEDQARFEIMQKVGMTKPAIRKSINSQLLTVFYLPLVFAALHLAFAFPMIRQLLLLFNLNNVTLFAATNGISFLIFALFYALVYRLTAGSYFGIVSGAREERLQ